MTASDFVNDADRVLPGVAAETKLRNDDRKRLEHPFVAGHAA